jgi:hypothetical protein
MTTVTLPIRGKPHSVARFLSRLSAEAKVVFRYDASLNGPIILSIDGPEPLPEREIIGFVRLRPDVAVVGIDGTEAAHSAIGDIYHPSGAMERRGPLNGTGNPEYPFG